MKIVLFLISIIFFIVFCAIALFIFLNKKEKNKNALIEQAEKILDEKGFVAKGIIGINSCLVIAINKKDSAIAEITINPTTTEYSYEVINSFHISKIEKKKNSIEITYIFQDSKKILVLNSTKQLEDIIYEIYKKAYVTRLTQKYNVQSYDLTSGSDWTCEYVWAYSEFRNIFAYYKTTEKIFFYKLNILKEFFTLDTKFNYFQAPIMGIDQQIFTYEKNFLDDLYKYLIQAIKQKATPFSKDKIYFDKYNNIVYLSNGMNSLQSLILSKISEVNYYENKLSFSLKDSKKEINFICDKTLVEKFDSFMTTYNLRRIANNFDYTTDKLINVTDNTKFIVDFTRDRIVYCANLNRLSKFSFIIIAFDNLGDTKLQKSGQSHFVRIFTKNKDIIDISCNKLEVAQYISAQLTTIMNR